MNLLSKKGPFVIIWQIKPLYKVNITPPRRAPHPGAAACCSTHRAWIKFYSTNISPICFLLIWLRECLNNDFLTKQKSCRLPFFNAWPWEVTKGQISYKCSDHFQTLYKICQTIIVYTLLKPNQQKTDRGYVCQVKCYSGTVCISMNL